MIFAFSSSVWRHWRRSHTRSLLVCLSLVFHVNGLSQTMLTITSTCSCALVTSVTFVTLAICCCRASVLQSLNLLSSVVHNGMPVDDSRWLPHPAAIFSAQIISSECCVSLCLFVSLCRKHGSPWNLDRLDRLGYQSGHGMSRQSFDTVGSTDVDRLSAGCRQVWSLGHHLAKLVAIPYNSIILIIWLDTCKSVIWIIQDNYWHTSDWWITEPEKKVRTPPRTYVPVLVGGADHIMILYVGSNLPNHAKAMQKTENTWKFIPNRTWYIV